MSYDTYFDTFMAVLAAFLSFFFGGLDSLMTVLLVFVACDIISGIIKGLALGKFSSDVGFRGISKKVFMFMFIGVANVLDHELFGKSEVLRDGVIMFYLTNEGLSIIENAIDNSNMIGQQHVIQALKLLKDGGRLVAILGGGREGNSTPHDKWLKHLGKKYNVNAVISIGGKAYSKYGTNFGNVIVVIDKTGATPENGTVRLKFSGDFNSFQDVSELFDTLADVRNNIQGGKTTKFSASKFVENNQLPERKTDIIPKTRENTAEKTVERIATVGEFHKTFDLLDKGRIFVRICDLRRNLDWPRDVFDKMLRDLRDNDVIQLHTGDASLMTPDEVADCFIDENNFRKGSITWHVR